MEFTRCPGSVSEAGTCLPRSIPRSVSLYHLKRLGIIDAELASGLDQAVLRIRSSCCVIV
jgi:hypothetical protein